MSQWWDEWQLRILVLASLIAQYLLVLSAGARKCRIPPWFKVLLRLVHVGSDALAIFALATLFNRQKGGPRCSYARGRHDLELLWAPILVMHLGGQVVIISYKIEDNEQWSRHILTSLSKVTVALYVFYKSWSSDDKRLLAATILLFILVTIRCVQKALDLKSSSFNALRKASSSEVSIVQSISVLQEEGHLDNFVKKAIEDALNYSPYFPLEEDHISPSPPYQLFLDLPIPYSDRLGMFRNFCSLNTIQGYKAIEAELSAMTCFLYTKEDNVTRYLDLKNAPAALIFRLCTQVLAYAMLSTAICLVHTSSHKKVYSGEDTWVTLVLLYGTLLLELVYLGVHSAFRDKFSGKVLQHNLIKLLAHNKRHCRLRRIAGWLYCKDFLNGFWHMEPTATDSCLEITALIHECVLSWWKGHIRDAGSYRRFNDTRGLHTVRGYCALGWSTRRPFDESIILWHLATDFCIHHKSTSPDDIIISQSCKEMSNYMMHLLSENPEMLLPGSRKSLFKRAYTELEDILKGVVTPQDEREFLQLVFEKSKEDSKPGSITRCACMLAEILLDICGGGQTEMWEVIKGVWVEMLCFSAGRSRGHMHAETLGTGVEYLSYVWVLWTQLGMETFPEKLQRTDSY